MGILLGVSVGVLQALRQYSVFDYLLSFIAFFYISLPGFFLALILIYIFALQFGLAAISRLRNDRRPPSWTDRLRYMVLPVMTLVFASAPGLMRYTRTAVLEVIRQPYTVTAQAKGLPRRQIVWRHVLRNSLIPVVTQLASLLPAIIGGSVIVEQVFDWPGMGRLAIRAVQNAIIRS